MGAAPSDPDRLYLSAHVLPTETDPRRGFMLRSGDGGFTFERIEIPLAPDEHAPSILAVDPTNADRLFVRMRKSFIDFTPERLLVSDDGGRTFEQAHSAPRMLAFALSRDWRTAWVGSAEGGLWIARDGALVFEPLAALRTRCLAVRGDELWICLDPNEGYEVGRSLDLGTSFEPVLSLDDVTELVHCDRCASTTVACVELVDDLIYNVDRYWGSMTLPMPPMADSGLLAQCTDGGGGPSDGGDRMDPRGGCGCAALASTDPPFVVGGIAVLVMLRRGRRRRSKYAARACIFARP